VLLCLCLLGLEGLAKGSLVLLGLDTKADTPANNSLVQDGPHRPHLRLKCSPHSGQLLLGLGALSVEDLSDGRVMLVSLHSEADATLDDRLIQGLPLGKYPLSDVQHGRLGHPLCRLPLRSAPSLLLLSELTQAGE
jgi:hypothetical protein